MMHSYKIKLKQTTCLIRKWFIINLISLSYLVKVCQSVKIKKIITIKLYKNIRFIKLLSATKNFKKFKIKLFRRQKKSRLN